MTFQNLDYFLATATEQSFTKAADKLYITQQSLSGHIAALEKELGSSLFYRSKPLKLTNAGKILYNYATEIMREYRKMKNEMQLMARQSPGEITVGVSFAGAIPPLKSILMELHEKMPGSKLRVVEMSGGDLIEKLRDGTVDFAIAHFPEHDPAFERFPLYEEEVILLVTEELLSAVYGETKDAVVREIEEKGNFALLKNCPYIHSWRNNIVSRFADRFMEQYVPTPIVSAESDSLETLIELCRNSAGFTFFPRSIALEMMRKDDNKRIRIFRLGESAKFPLHYGYLRDVPRNETFSRFLKITGRYREARMQSDIPV